MTNDQNKKVSGKATEDQNERCPSFRSDKAVCRGDLPGDEQLDQLYGEELQRGFDNRSGSFVADVSSDEEELGRGV